MSLINVKLVGGIFNVGLLLLRVEATLDDDVLLCIKAMQSSNWHDWPVMPAGSHAICIHLISNFASLQDTCIACVLTKLKREIQSAARFAVVVSVQSTFAVRSQP